MMNATMDARLIKANIALFNGSRSEARRLLNDYSAAVPEPSEDALPMVLWLNAQAQDDREARKSALESLVEKVSRNNRYAQLAANYLANEEKYAVDAKPAAETTDGTTGKRRLPKILGVDLWKVAVMVGIGAGIGILILSVLAPPRPTTQIPQNIVANATLTTGVVPTSAAQALPRATSIAPETHQVEYREGILQVSAVEPDSQRVANFDGVAQQPSVAGSQFYAVKLIFECREGVCNQPPQADLLLQMTDGVLLPPVEEVGLIGENLMQGVAQGRSTNGWVVFEIPATSNVSALVSVPPRPPDAPPNFDRTLQCFEPQGTNTGTIPCVIALGAAPPPALQSLATAASPDLSAEVTPDDNSSS
jgi:hypothetical protein